MSRPVVVAVALSLVATLGACSGSDQAAERSTTTTTAAVTTTTVVPGADWEVSTPEAEGFDPKVLERAHDYAFAKGRNTQGVVIVRHGKIAQEWYADGAGPDSWAASWSMAKSFASALVGIAIDEGKIPDGVDAKMTTWFPAWEQLGLGDVTLRDVLQMADGQRWNEDYDPAKGPSDIIDMVFSQSDELEFAATRPRAVAPGTTFNYSSGTAMLLSEVIAESTGTSAAEYARRELFDPMQFSKAEWWSDAEGHTLTYCCVDTTSRDFARFGLLYLRQGRWGDRQIVPSSWVEESLTGAPTSPKDYGYQWWLEDGQTAFPKDLFAAQGFDGQYIFVVPSLDLVVVRNGTYVKDPGPPVADPTLFEHYPPSGYGDGRGTVPPDTWDDVAFLTPILDAIER